MLLPLTSWLGQSLSISTDSVCSLASMHLAVSARGWFCSYAYSVCILEHPTLV